MREEELLASEPSDSSQIARSTPERHQALDTISTESKEFAAITQLKMCNKSLEDNVV